MVFPQRDWAGRRSLRRITVQGSGSGRSDGRPPPHLARRLGSCYARVALGVTFGNPRPVVRTVPCRGVLFPKEGLMTSEHRTMPSCQVDYDSVAELYDRRYRDHRYGGVERKLQAFSVPDGMAVLEVGCGTGHWLSLLEKGSVRAVGIDPSRAMLHRARETAPKAELVQGVAEALPCSTGSFDRVLCVNAVHHFSDPLAFVAEASRVLSPRGAVMVVGLDPHTGSDRWWVYDFFPEALRLDRNRYPSSETLRSWMESAGFIDIDTTEAEHFSFDMPVSGAENNGSLERSSTSQLMVIADEEFERGTRRIRDASADADGGALILSTDVRLYATLGWLP